MFALNTHFLNHRWDEEAVEQFPAYLKALYINILNTTNVIDEELKHQKNMHAGLAKKMVNASQNCTKLFLKMSYIRELYILYICPFNAQRFKLRYYLLIIPQLCISNFKQIICSSNALDFVSIDGANASMYYV